MNYSAEFWIKKLNLIPHPEGGYYAETYRSEEFIAQENLPERYRSDRPFGTAIYFLLKGNQFSILHKLKSDEIWHFYDGSALTLFIIKRNDELSRIVLGNDAERGEIRQALAPKQCWFGASVNNPKSYALVGCTVAPGFDFEDIEYADRNLLVRLYPQHREIIEKLTKT